MRALIGILTGLFAGWFTGYAFKGRGYGVLGSLLDGGATRAHRLATGPDGPPLGALEYQIHRLGEVERKVLSHVLHRKPVTRDIHVEFEAQTTFGQRVVILPGSWTAPG